MARYRQQPARALLPDHAGWTPSTRHRESGMGSHGGDHARALAQARVERRLMRALRELVRRLWGTIRRSPSDRDLEEELRFHLDQVSEGLRNRGALPDEARRAARLQAGAIAQTMESLRDQRGLPFLETLVRD